MLQKRIESNLIVHMLSAKSEQLHHDLKVNHKSTHSEESDANPESPIILDRNRLMIIGHFRGWLQAANL